MRNYDVQMEIAGPLAMFTRVDTGATPTSYPVPTWSAAKGLFDAIAMLKSGDAWISPLRVEVCRRRDRPGGSVRFESYATNYGGPLRKANQIAKGASLQLYATVLADVCYRLHAEVRGSPAIGSNPRHQLRDMFRRRLERGQCHVTPTLGWSEFTCSYWGSFRDKTEVDESLDTVIPSMLSCLWSKPVDGHFAPRFAQEVRIVKGVLVYAGQ